MCLLRPEKHCRARSGLDGGVKKVNLNGWFPLDCDQLVSGVFPNWLLSRLR